MHSAHTLEKGAVYSIFGQFLKFLWCFSGILRGFGGSSVVIWHFSACAIDTGTLFVKKLSFLAKIHPAGAEFGPFGTPKMAIFRQFLTKNWQKIEKFEKWLFSRSKYQKYQPLAIFWRRYHYYTRQFDYVVTNLSFAFLAKMSLK